MNEPGKRKQGKGAGKILSVKRLKSELKRKSVEQDKRKRKR